MLKALIQGAKSAVVGGAKAGISKGIEGRLGKLIGGRHVTPASGQAYTTADAARFASDSRSETSALDREIQRAGLEQRRVQSQQENQLRQQEIQSRNFQLQMQRMELEHRARMDHGRFASERAARVRQQMNDAKSLPEKIDQALGGVRPDGSNKWNPVSTLINDPVGYYTEILKRTPQGQIWNKAIVPFWNRMTD